MKRILILAGLLLAQLSFGQALWRNPWSTNVPPAPVQGVNNLSVTNLGTGTNWQFYNVGPKTVARLGDVTNVVNAIGGGISTNGNQFLGVPLSIKAAALLTNLNTFNLTNAGAFTNTGNVGIAGHTYADYEITLGCFDGDALIFKKLGVTAGGITTDGESDVSITGTSSIDLQSIGSGNGVFVTSDHLLLNAPITTNSGTLNVAGVFKSFGGTVSGIGTLSYDASGLNISADDSLGGVSTLLMQGHEVINVDTNSQTLWFANGIGYTNLQFGLYTPFIWVDLIGGYPSYGYLTWGKPTAQWSNIYSINLYGTNLYPRNATASRLAAIGPDGILTNSQYSETTIANLQGGTNGLNTAVSNLQNATNQFGNTNRFIASDSGLGTNNILYNGNLASDQLASDTSTKTNYWEAGSAYPGATSVNSGGQLRLNGGLGPARIAITNWNRFTNSICTNVISTVDGILTLYATNGACAGCWTNGASLVTCATNLATNIAGALFFGSTLRISNYVTVSANGSNVFFQPLAKVEMMTVGSVTNGATNLNATVNAVLLQPVSGNVGIGTNAPGMSLDVLGSATFAGNTLTVFANGNESSSGNWTNTGALIAGQPDRAFLTASGLGLGNAKTIIWTANANPVGSPSDVTLYRHGIGTNGIGTSVSTPAGNLLCSNISTKASILIGGGTLASLAQLHVTNSTTQVGARIDQQGTTNDAEQVYSNSGLLRAQHTNSHQFYTPILAPTNAALVTTVAPANLHNIALGKGWTNDLGARADIVMSVKFTDAVAGDPSLAFTNTVTGEAWTNKFAFGIAGSMQELIVIPDLSTNDYGSFTEISGTGASVTILNAWWKLK